MQIQDLNVFLEYREKVHQRTMRVARCIPPDKVEWSYQDGNLSWVIFSGRWRPSNVTCLRRPLPGGRVVTRDAARSWAMAAIRFSQFVTSCMLNRSRSFPGFLQNS